MEFEWDKEKARENLAKHGIDFQGATRVFETEPLLEVRATRGEEERWKVIGVVEDVMIAVVYTWRSERGRIISARRAKRNERRAYRQAYPGGSEEG